MTTQQKIFTALLVLIALFIFSIGNGRVHLFDWDEINFAESAREMIVSDDYLTVQVDFKPFWEKPPFFIWLQVASMKIFGINEFAARFPNAFFGALTVLMLIIIGRKLKDFRFGLLWTAVYFASILPFFYSKSGIIDPIFNFFIFLGLYFFINYLNSPNKVLKSILSGFFIGMAVLTKGPVGFLIYFLAITVFTIIKKFKISIKFVHIVYFGLTLVFVGGFWFVLQILNGNFSIIIDFIYYQIDLFSNKVAGHGGFLLYHFVVLFVGLFPAILLAFPELISFRKTYDFNLEFALWMKILFWTVLILFTIVKTKIVHYSSMCYLPASFLGAMLLNDAIDGRYKFPKYLNILFMLDALIIGLAVISLPLVEKFKYFIILSNIIKDPVALEALKAKVEWSWLVYAIGVWLILSTITALYFKNKTKYQHFAAILLSSTILFTFLSMFLVVGNVEKYSQNAVIEFYKKHSDNQTYVNVLGFKSYAHLFYTNKKPQKTDYDTETLINGQIDKPALFVVKISSLDYFLQTYPNLELMYKQNGFGFLKRRDF